MAAELRVRVDDVPMGGMKQAEDGDATVLFVRDVDGVRAFAAKCPHYGAPLAKGAICGRVLYCPWHKAAFDIGNGHVVAPPALEGLARYPVRIEGAEAIAILTAIDADGPRALEADKHFVVVGTGTAAVSAVMTLRREGFAGKITMIGREDSPPYDRTALSKKFLAKTTPAASTLLEKNFYAHYDVEAVIEAATKIEPDARRVTLSGGRVIVGDALLIATGSRAVMPSIPRNDLGNVFTLRSLANAVALSNAAENAKHATIVGGGFIGLEAAAFLKKRGLDIDVVAPEALPLAKRFGEEVARALKTYHEGNGIRIRQGEVVRFTGGKGRVVSVELESGRPIATDLVLIGAGAKPETGTIEGVAKREDGGVTVDDRLRLAEGCWAAGDIAAFPEARSKTTARIEHWRLAEQHGAHVARAMLGADAPFRPAPFFWTNQGDKRLDYAGYAPKWDRIIVCGEIERLDFIAYYILDGHAHAACAIGQNHQMIAFLHLLDEARLPSAADLATGDLATFV